jgi:hypothetical protein
MREDEIEKTEPAEKELTPREKLFSLEKEGKFVFHGSPNVMEVLEPRQAYGENKKTGQQEKDGKPAIFTSPHANIAIFRALINEKNLTGDSTISFGINGEQLVFSATKNLIEEAKNKTGMVYVLNKQEFKKFKGMQCRSEKLVVPIEVIKVTVNDLPQNIEIIAPEMLDKNQ